MRHVFVEQRGLLHFFDHHRNVAQLCHLNTPYCRKRLNRLCLTEVSGAQHAVSTLCGVGRVAALWRVRPRCTPLESCPAEKETMGEPMHVWRSISAARSRTSCCKPAPRN